MRKKKTGSAAFFAEPRLSEEHVHTASVSMQAYTASVGSSMTGTWHATCHESNVVGQAFQA